MNPSARRTAETRASAPTATCWVSFRDRGRPEKCTEERPARRETRVPRLLALAHKIDGMINSGELKDWAEAARLIGITRARMAQIAQMLFLSPGIQESILCEMEGMNFPSFLNGGQLRHVGALTDWMEQLQTWTELLKRLGAS